MMSVEGCTSIEKLVYYCWFACELHVVPSPLGGYHSCGLCLAYSNELWWLGYSLAAIHISFKSRLELYDSLEFN